MRCALKFIGLNHRYKNRPLFVSSKVNLYRSLHTKLADEHSSLDQRANELRNASQGLVRDSGNIGGGLDSNNLDVFIC
jgi:hypothetical protein